MFIIFGVSSGEQLWAVHSGSIRKALKSRRLAVGMVKGIPLLSRANHFM